MKMFSDCSGPCVACAASGGCLAGHGDDHFSPAKKKVLLERFGLCVRRAKKELRGEVTLGSWLNARDAFRDAEILAQYIGEPLLINEQEKRSSE